MEQLEGLVQCGRWVTAEELGEVITTVGLFPRLSRLELARTICEHLGWQTAGGSYKVDACLKLLAKLEARGLLQLPAKRRKVASRSKSVVLTADTAPQAAVEGPLRELGEVRLEAVWGAESRRLWNEYVERYHYLGYKRPFGCSVRYFIRSPRGVLGCMLVAGAARAIGVRDRWIGWSEGQRLRNLGLVVNNARYVLFPWVQVSNLASHVLGRLARRLRADWLARWGYAPVLLETFVDPRYFDGGCYKAAGWQSMGMTTGEGLVRPGKTYHTSAKKVFVRPLVREFRALLCSERSAGEVP